MERRKNKKDTQKYSPEAEANRFKQLQQEQSRNRQQKKKAFSQPSWQHLKKRVGILLEKALRLKLLIANPSATDPNRDACFQLQAQIKAAIQQIYNVNIGHKRHAALREDSVDDEGMVDLNDITCSKCLLEDEEGNDIIICDGKDCFRAYHVNCLVPKVKLKDINSDPDADWVCHECATVGWCFAYLNTYYKTDYRSMEELFPHLPNNKYHIKHKRSAMSNCSSVHRHPKIINDISGSISADNDDDDDGFELGKTELEAEVDADDNDSNDARNVRTGPDRACNSPRRYMIEDIGDTEDEKSEGNDRDSDSDYDVKHNHIAWKASKSAKNKKNNRESKSKCESKSVAIRASKDCSNSNSTDKAAFRVVKIANCTGCQQQGIYSKVMTHKVENSKTSQIEICGKFTISPRIQCPPPNDAVYNDNGPDFENDEENILTDKNEEGREVECMEGARIVSQEIQPDAAASAASTAVQENNFMSTAIEKEDNVSDDNKAFDRDAAAWLTYSQFCHRYSLDLLVGTTTSPAAQIFKFARYIIKHKPPLGAAGNVSALSIVTMVGKELIKKNVIESMSELHTTQMQELFVSLGMTVNSFAGNVGNDSGVCNGDSSSRRGGCSASCEQGTLKSAVGSSSSNAQFDLYDSVNGEVEKKVNTDNWPVSVPQVQSSPVHRMCCECFRCYSKALFNRKGTSTPRFCREHMKKGMVLVHTVIKEEKDAMIIDVGKTSMNKEAQKEKNKKKKKKKMTDTLSKLSLPVAATAATSTFVDPTPASTKNYHIEKKNDRRKEEKAQDDACHVEVKMELDASRQHQMVKDMVNVAVTEDTTQCVSASVYSSDRNMRACSPLAQEDKNENDDQEKLRCSPGREDFPSPLPAITDKYSPCYIPASPFAAYSPSRSPSPSPLPSFLLSAAAAGPASQTGNDKISLGKRARKAVARFTVPPPSTAHSNKKKPSNDSNISNINVCCSKSDSDSHSQSQYQNQNMSQGASQDPSEDISILSQQQHPFNPSIWLKTDLQHTVWGVAYKKIYKHVQALSKSIYLLDVVYMGGSDSNVITMTSEINKTRRDIQKEKDAIRDVIAEIKEHTSAHIRLAALSEGDAQDMIDVEEVLCSKCQESDVDDDHDIYLCDMRGCNRAYHLACLDPPIKKDHITTDPNEDWFCWECRVLSDILLLINDRTESSYDTLEDVFCDSTTEGRTSLWEDEDSEDDEIFLPRKKRKRVRYRRECKEESGDDDDSDSDSMEGELMCSDDDDSSGDEKGNSRGRRRRTKKEIVFRQGQRETQAESGGDKSKSGGYKSDILSQELLSKYKDMDRSDSDRADEDDDDGEVESDEDGFSADEDLDSVISDDELGGLIEEAGEDVDLYMLHQHKTHEHENGHHRHPENTAEGNDPNCRNPLLKQRPPSKRLKLLSQGSAGSVGGKGENDVRPRNVHGFLASSDLLVADLIEGVKVARVKKGYVQSGSIVQKKKKEVYLVKAESTSSFSQSLSSQLNAREGIDAAEDMLWEVQYDDETKTVWLNWKDICAGYCRYADYFAILAESFKEKKTKIAIDEISSSSIIEGKRHKPILDYAALHEEFFGHINPEEDEEEMDDDFDENNPDS